jgi:pantetheine-phosphate adenylyltransferase
MEKAAVYAGSFDPVTKGHLDIIKRSSKLFDKVIVAVLNNGKKKYWFDLEERKALIKKSLGPDIKVEILSFSGLLVDFMKENDASILIRGLRAVSDYEYELQLALTNNVLANNSIETIFLTASRENLYLSASIVKEIAINNGDISEFVSGEIIEDIKKKVNKLR